MAISLNQNISALQVSGRLASTSEKLNGTLGRLSSGLRIQKPGDDPAGMQIADTLKADAKIAGAALQNASTAISYTSIADAALSGVSTLLTRMAELAEQSANGVYANSQRSALSNEFMALGSEIQRIARTTEFNGTALLSNGANVTIQIGLDGGTDSRLTLNAITGTLAGLGLATSGSNALTYSILGGTEANSLSASRLAIDAVSAALGSLNSTRGSIGAVESRLGTAVNYLTSVREQFLAAESRIRDADIATEVAEMVRLQVLQQAQAAVLGQANQQVSVALSLLG
ncbi:flagellin [Oligoflexia bacterium]|nr:flagellin [Oligoflexia bacterium]